MRSAENIHRQKNPLPLWRDLSALLIASGPDRDKEEGKQNPTFHPFGGERLLFLKAE
jgi:hypothetical protein